MRSGFATGIQVISNSSEDVDFYIHELYPIHFFGTTVYITTTHVCTFIVLLVIAILAICARRSVLKTRDNPSKFATGVELAIESTARWEKKLVSIISITSEPCSYLYFFRTYPACLCFGRRPRITERRSVSHLYHLS